MGMQSDGSADIAGAPHDFVMRLVSLSLPDHPSMSWETEVAFFMEEWAINYGILGHQGFLDRFVVSFNYSANYFVVQTPDAWEEIAPITTSGAADPFEEFQKDDPSWWRPTEY